MFTSTVSQQPVHPAAASAESLVDPISEDTRARPIRELDRRRAAGIDVRLLWNQRDDVILLVVSDSKTGEAFSVDVDPRNALEAFHHPYSFAASKREYMLAG